MSKKSSDKINTITPILILTYGFPGAGKTYFARQLAESIQIAHLEQDRIRHELFQQPRYSKQENSALNRIMTYMTNEFLTAGISVIMDMNAMRVSQRRSLREMARLNGANTLVVWFQIDPDTAFLRNHNRDRRTSDDKYAVGYDVESFKQMASYMENPEPTEDFMVVSGKHSFNGQLSTIVKKLSDLGNIKSSAAAHKMIKPELVNLVPTPHGSSIKPGSRRNIVLR
ncbi:ATP-binding protein [Candidatus Saccharibacteria bacterium]|nr:ATP-binding protein [Candidatus Saccharibacteria bacterium]